MKKLGFTLCCCLFVACHSSPPYSHEVRLGVVRANSPDGARRVAELAAKFALQVTSLLGVPCTRPFWIEWDDRGDRSLFTYVLLQSGRRGDPVRIELNAKYGRTFPNFVAHELTHWYVRDPWDRLPPALEDGLAEWVAMQCVPELEAERRGILARELETTTRPVWDRYLAATWRNYQTLSADRHATNHAVGFFIVDQLGIERLRELCERAKRESKAMIPLPWLTESLELPPHLRPEAASPRPLEPRDPRTAR